MSQPIFSIINKRYLAKHAYQKTLNLPKTKFPNRSNLDTTLRELIPKSSQEVYKEQLDSFFKEFSKLSTVDDKLKFVKERLFILHDGPPYANGDLHLGHALNKVLKDIINRYQLSQGKYIFYKPGWDCHGLPIETKALKDLNAQQIDLISPLKIRSLALKHAQKAMKKQRQTFEHFAILTDWETPYITIDKDYENNQLKTFKEMFERGLIKRQNKPVYWGTETRTALAEGELEYNENHKSVAAYVKFPLVKESEADLRKKLGITGDLPIYCLIWTSTPWTLFSNRAICFNEDFSYSLLRIGKELVIVETDSIGKLGQPSGSCTVIKQFQGTNLHGLYYQNRLLNDKICRPLLNGVHVTSGTGTGLVHTAPGHGQDDYLIGIQNNLEIYSPVDHQGRYQLSELPESVRSILKDEEDTSIGKQVLDVETTKVILQKLNDLNLLHKFHDYTHSYPYDWRSKKPVIIRATPQWFADLHDVKDLALESIKRVKFYPERGHSRLSSFIKSRNEWCISRQRSWGIPILSFYKKDEPDTILMNSETLAHAMKTVEKKGINAWFNGKDDDMKEWLPQQYHGVAHEYCRSQDTMDVWFDSGSSWNIIKDFYEKRLKLTKLPSPLYQVCLEGSDQHRGWFQSSLLTKVASSNVPVAPYEEVITHGFTLDENGLKMSKSIGNTISPEAIIQGDETLGLPALGVDGLRYLIAQSNFTTDIVAGPTVMKHVGEALKKIRLAFRYLLSNLQKSEDFNLLPVEQLRRADQFALYKMNELLNTTKNHYQNHNFSKVLIALQYHLNNHLSAFYFDISKDTLYSDSISFLKRKQVQTTLFHVLNSYRAILAPILPVMVQEVWKHTPERWLQGLGLTNISPMRGKWPHFEVCPEINDSFEEFELKILELFQKEFKKLNQEEGITKTTQTHVTVFTDHSLPFSSSELCDILQASAVSIMKGISGNSSLPAIELGNGSKLQILVEQSKQHVCPRCWKANSAEEDELCDRCGEVVSELAP
ncbi:isoleucine--tRNA ligase ISM1 [Saccharomyces eubayanus]|uniref:isoleucine--tRNA ligase ISM1 n=1 Tax=Saccharomyces eubayanus TaxID=1080349 RepID=UPI0006C34DD9|nr:ISM1-like protein [Saccharomyces eubayanus]KOG96268.1 ISM1-like protein [Saccharomyces eubayanus]